MKRPTREEAMAMHPSNWRRLRAVWTPQDTADVLAALAEFDAHAEQAVAVVAEDTAVVIDFRTRKRLA